MVRLLLCNSMSPAPAPATYISRSSSPTPAIAYFPTPDYPQKNSPVTQYLCTTVLSVALSLGIFFTSPSEVISLEFTAPQGDLTCLEESIYTDDKSVAKPATNVEIVEEAWQVVYETYFGNGRYQWSPGSWIKKKGDILGVSMPTQSRAHGVIRRMLASLGDEYTRFLSPSQLSKMKRYDMTGIGINLREILDDKGVIKLKVLGLILDGPAHSAGVKQGDELLSVDGVDVQGKSAFEASSMLQGPGETFVNITVKHGNCGPIQSIDIERQSVAKSPVFYRLEQPKNGLKPGGYVRIKEFNALARKDLVTALGRLKDMGASYLVLDLRDNLGGLVQVGIEIAKLFLNKGETVTYTVGRDSVSMKSIVADNSPLFTAPVIVLVNGNTASASEIVVTALHDNCRAAVVGERTFGKGLIQSVFELNDGSGMVVTVGKYVTPKHMDINGNGVDPDFHNIPAWNEVNKYLSECRAKPHEG